MASKLWKVMSFALKLLITISTPVFLFSGVALFDVNDLYIWYMMHSKSLLAAVASFLCIVVLYIFAMPDVFSLFESREEHHSLEVNSISQHNTCHDEYSKRDGSILTNLLAMTLQQQINAKEVQQKVENNTKSNLHDQVSISIKQISELHGLRLSDTLSMREYKYLKEMLVNKLIQMLKTDEDDYDKESSSRQ